MNANVLPVPSPQRLRSSRDFRRVLARGARVTAGPIVAVVADGEPGRARLGVTAGRTVGRAVARNRVKRQIRAASAGLDLPAGTDSVVVAKPGVIGRSFQEIRTFVMRALAGAQDRR